MGEEAFLGDGLRRREGEPYPCSASWESRHLSHRGCEKHGEWPACTSGFRQQTQPRFSFSPRGKTERCGSSWEKAGLGGGAGGSAAGGECGPGRRGAPAAQGALTFPRPRCPRPQLPPSLRRRRPAPKVSPAAGTAGTSGDCAGAAGRGEPRRHRGREGRAGQGWRRAGSPRRARPGRPPPGARI